MTFMVIVEGVWLQERFIGTKTETFAVSYEPPLMFAFISPLYIPVGKFSGTAIVRFNGADSVGNMLLMFEGVKVRLKFRHTVSDTHQNEMLVAFAFPMDTRVKVTFFVFPPLITADCVLSAMSICGLDKTLNSMLVAL